MKKSLTILPLIAITAIAFTTGSANAQGDHNLIRLAHNIEGIANNLQLEFRTHYAHSGAYRHLMADVAKVRSEAKHIDQLAHNCQASLHHIKADLRDLDQLAHHLHDLVDAVEHGRYGGHIDGSTHHVHTMLSSLNNSIHQMERVVASYAAPSHHGHYSSPSYGHGHRGHVDPRASAVNTILRTIIRSSGHHGHHGH